MPGVMLTIQAKDNLNRIAQGDAYAQKQCQSVMKENKSREGSWKWGLRGPEPLRAYNHSIVVYARLSRNDLP